jgi:hypothetical protein
MSDQPVEGKVVSTRSSRNAPAVRDTGSSRGAPRTEYVYVRDSGTGQRGYRSVSYGQNGVNKRSAVPKGVPSFLGNREILFGAWAVSMGLVAWDEWKVNGILPRPLRLWDTTLVYMGLALLSAVDAFVPIANALAIGYTITLLYQFFTGSGNFGGPGV